MATASVQTLLSVSMVTSFEIKQQKDTDHNNTDPYTKTYKKLQSHERGSRGVRCQTNHHVMGAVQVVEAEEP